MQLRESVSPDAFSSLHRYGHCAAETRRGIPSRAALSLSPWWPALRRQCGGPGRTREGIRYHR